MQNAFRETIAQILTFCFGFIVAQLTLAAYETRTLVSWLVVLAVLVLGAALIVAIRSYKRI